MAKYYNSKDYNNYVDFMTAGQYGNNPAYKVKLANLWKQILAKDTSKIKINKILKFGVFKDQQQALFETTFHEKTGCIFGISYDQGGKWYFTQVLQNPLNFNTVSKDIPSIDYSFASLVDPKFQKRVNYEIGKVISPFNFKDLNDVPLSSESLKGKIIALNFWGIGCGPCIMEIPELNDLVEKMKGKPVVFIAPAIGSPKEILLKNFLPKHPFNYRIVQINNDDYNIISFPTHIIIDKDLKVYEIITGYSKENVQKLQQTITKLLVSSEK
jgi:thiol-disulfide isomerase/thioredoxin